MKLEVGKKYLGMFASHHMENLLEVAKAAELFVFQAKDWEVGQILYWESFEELEEKLKKCREVSRRCPLQNHSYGENK